MSKSKDYYFRLKGEKWRGGCHDLSLEAEGLYIHVVSLMQETPDCGYPNDAAKMARKRGLRDKRTVAKPLAELIEAGKFLVWRGRLYNPTVCRDRHALAVYRKTRSPVPAEVWPLIEAAELSTEAVDEPEDELGTPPRDRDQFADSRRSVRDQIAISSGKVVVFQRPALPESESKKESRSVVVTESGTARARGDPERSA